MSSLYTAYITTIFNFCILGALSGARESWEYDSGARDLQSPDLQSHFTLQKVLENGGSNVAKQAALQKLLSQASNYSSSVGGNYLELANTVSTFFLSSPIDYLFLLFYTYRSVLIQPLDSHGNNVRLPVCFIYKKANVILASGGV